MGGAIDKRLNIEFFQVPSIFYNNNLADFPIASQRDINPPIEVPTNKSNI